MKRSMATAESEEYFGDERPDPAVGTTAVSCEAENRLASLLKHLAALAWPVLLGYSEAKLLVRNSKFSDEKSHASNRWKVLPPLE